MSRMPATPTPSDRDGRFNRPDASMSLLTTVMEHSLDDGYAEAAKARGDEGPYRLPGNTRGRLVLALGLGLAAIVVTVGAVNSHEAAPTLAKERDALIHRVNDETKAADALQRQVEQDRSKVEQTQQQALRSSGDGGVADLAASTGTAEMVGPGIKLLIEDASGTGQGGNVSDPRNAETFGNSGRLRDHDLQYAVNGLWQAGAEGVSINGQRLTNLSAIRAAGDAILVDNRPLVPPYTVLAIGDGPKLAQAFQENQGGRYLKIIQDSYGIKSTISVQKSVTLPAAVGVTLRVAKPDLPSASAGASASPSSSASPSTSTTAATGKPTTAPSGTGAPTP
ncbi:DUF881 domain-containing protein [Kitasatospora paracochleata]|nr:DUF881 domain-containing protein [Kitasatospora paracochleata]